MQCTEKMYLFAKAISEILDLQEPDYEDFNKTSEFINDNKEAYNKICFKKKVLETNENEFAYKKEILEVLENLYGHSGCYVLWNARRIVYIGKSTNLAERVFASILERNSQIEITAVTLILTTCEADAHILEPILITERKPILNTEFMCKGISSVFASNISFEELLKSRIVLKDLKDTKEFHYLEYGEKL